MLIRQFIQSVLGLVFLVTSSLALSNTEFTYNVIEGGIEITGCVDACPSDLVIPDSIDGYSVTRIGYAAFQFNQLISVTISDSVINIESEAFAGNQLTSVTIPHRVTSIGNAFAANELTEVIIKGDIVRISAGAFYNNQLTRVTFIGSRPIIDSHAFYENNNLFSIFYCSGTAGWPGEPIVHVTPSAEWTHDTIYLITPRLDEACEAKINLYEPIQYSLLDLDQNGNFDALTDALILIRYAFGLRGDSLISNAVASDANRTSAEEIETHIQSLLP